MSRLQINGALWGPDRIRLCENDGLNWLSTTDSDSEADLNLKLMISESARCNFKTSHGPRAFDSNLKARLSASRNSCVLSRPALRAQLYRPFAGLVPAGTVTYRDRRLRPGRD